MGASTLEAIRDEATRLSGAPSDYDRLIERAGRARVVLIGESTHGTHEFYRERAVITRRLIAEKGFAGVAAEADWPDACLVDAFVREDPEGREAIDALAGFTRFPAWMWRNADVLDFVGWLREHGARTADSGRKPGFFGLDLYSLHASMERVLCFLDQADPEAGRRARERYGCFSRFRSDGQGYGYAASVGLARSCEEEAVAQLVEMQQLAAETRQDGDALFTAVQNARLVKNAEAYYRMMFAGRVVSWNLRDRHMMETLEALLAHLDRRWGTARLVVWAHNSHIGDAGATEFGEEGETNLGELARRRWGDDAYLVGMTTATGTVTAAQDWGASARRMRVSPPLEGSYEALFHQAGLGGFLLDLREGDCARLLQRQRLERAIGVVYRPQTERWSHYFHARLAEQFDALIHLDHSRALEPLERIAEWSDEEPPETYPSAF